MTQPNPLLGECRFVLTSREETPDWRDRRACGKPLPCPDHPDTGVRPRVSTAEQRLRQLRSRLDTANVRADEAIADYETRRRKLTQANPSPVAYQMAKRDDTLLAEIGRRVEFQTTLATRLAATMTVELLAAVVRHLTNGDGR